MISNRLSDLELSAYLCSRICHDVISPVGAIVNGLELMNDESDEQMRAFALELVCKSAKQASAKLQFIRMAFGSAGSAGAEIDLSDAAFVIRGYMEGGKVELDWRLPQSMFMGKDKVKFLLNFILIALQGIPRGGRLSVAMEGDVSSPHFLLEAQGENARIPNDSVKFLTGDIECTVDTQLIQPYYTARLVEICNFDIFIDLNEDVLLLRSVPRSEAE
ncbi:MAG: histidine phosphotransferase family protein [Alphaproteobacteria bacterium]|nr:histidine phosphotransferase family protein [Alphaproteobacteria bacterium]